MRKVRWRVYCKEVENHVCCVSCLEEWDNGYGNYFEKSMSKNIDYLHCYYSGENITRAEAIKIIRERKNRWGI